MASEDRTRHERLRALLPRVYATDPRTSVLGALLDVLGDELRSFDRATERAQRDKWLTTAEAPPEVATNGTIALDREPWPLEHLGALLDLLRQPWEVDEEAYRRRVALLARLVTTGLATPRSILMFTVTALGAEPCPALEREDDATVALGFPADRVARCRTCRGGRELPTEPCPWRAEHTLSAGLVDNPRIQLRVSRTSVIAEADSSGTIRFESNSLFSDRPALEVTVATTPTPPAGTLVVPSFRSRQTRERIVVLHALAPGQTLSILPVSPHDPSVAPHRQRWVDRPPAGNPSAPEVHIDGVLAPDVPVILFRDDGFDAARFDVSAFGDDGGVQTFDDALFDVASFDYDPTHGALEVTTPAVVPGVNTWDYVPLGLDDVLLALERLPPEVPAPAAPAIGSASLQPVAVRLRWWSRPAALFALRIPPTAAVLDVAAKGGAQYLRRMVERVRPVGVTALIEFPLPAFRDVLDPADTEVLVEIEVPPTGSFDATVFDFSLLSA